MREAICTPFVVGGEHDFRVGLGAKLVPLCCQQVAEVEQSLRQDRDVEAPPLVPVDRGGSLPLSFAQQRLWIIDQLEPGSTAYHVPLALRLTGNLDVGALHGSLAEILRRHEALRTHFEVRDGSKVRVAKKGGTVLGKA